jgi:enoyl-CoA hydratase/carnithine racemase
VGDYTTIRFEVDDDHVATVTLDRPATLNAFNEVMANEIVDVWATVRDTDDIHAVVLRAEGERAFCTGIDVTEGVWWYHLNIWNQADPGFLLGPKAHKCWKPVVTAIHGMCAGGGMYFANESDIIICSDDATFFDPHASRGVVSALEPIGLLKRNIPLGDVLRWALLGNEERLTAETALRLGIVTEIVPREALWDRAHELAAEIASRRPEAIQGSVRAIWESLDMARVVALQNGILFTHIGNPSPGEKPTLAPKRDPRFR